jgi:hypothetical protein
MFHTVTVTETVIPASNMDSYDRSMKRRKELGLELQLAFEKFSRLESEIQFLHKQTVIDAQRALEEVVRLVEEYKSTLGW